MTFQIQNAYKSFGNKCILDNISYDFSHAGLYIITGKSGNGKSTLLNILAGFETLDQGEVINDQDLKISYIFQNFELIDDLTIEENINLPEQILDFQYKDKDHLLAKLNIQDLLHHYPHELSGGQKQRIGIARAIILDADVYLCDEPTESLDQSNIDNVMELLYELSKTKIVIIVTHNRSIIKQHDMTIIHLHDGTIDSIKTSNIVSDITQSQSQKYDIDKVKHFVDLLIQKKTKQQLSMLIFFMITMLVLSFIYMIVFPIKTYNKTVNQNVVFIDTKGDSLKDNNLIPILSFLDFDTKIQYIPIHVEPLFHKPSYLEINGSQIIKENQVMINQNMAEQFMQYWNLSEDELINKKLPLQCRTKDGKITLNFKITSIINEEDAGAYSKIYYDKDSLDQLLKNTPYFNNTIYDYVYSYNDYAIITSPKLLKKTYDNYSNYSPFNIQLTQANELNKQISSYKLYFIIFFTVLFTLQIIFIIYNCFKDWKYHLGTFAVLCTIGAKISDIQKEYFAYKCKCFFVSLSLIELLNLLGYLYFHSMQQIIFISIYIIVVLGILLICTVILTKSLKYKDIANILKNDKEIK